MPETWQKRGAYVHTTTYRFTYINIIGIQKLGKSPSSNSLKIIQQCCCEHQTTSSATRALVRDLMTLEMGRSYNYGDSVGEGLLDFDPESSTHFGSNLVTI